MSQYPVEAAGVGSLEPPEPALQNLVQPSVFGSHREDARAQHRGQGEGDEERDEDGGRDRDSELEEELADHALHVGDGDEDRRDREGCGHGREGNLASSVVRRLVGVLALLLVAEDVFQHDDSVVDHHAHRQRQGQGCEVVEREAEDAHEAEGGNERGRDGERDDEGRAPGAQEDEDDEDRQDGAVDDVDLDVLDRFFDVLGAVEGDVEVEARREVLGQLLHPLAGAAVDFDQVGAGAGSDAETERRCQVVAPEPPFIGDAELGEADVGEADRSAVDGGDDEVVEVLHVLEEPHVAHRQLGHPAFDEPARQLQVFAAERPDHVIHHEPMRGELVAVDPESHHGFAEPGHEHVADALDRLQPRLDHLVGVIRQLAGVEACQRHPQHGLRVDVEFLHDRRLGIERQLPDRTGDLVADVLGRDVDVALEGEGDGHLRHALTRVRGQLLDALDGVDRGLDDIRDVRLHDLGRGAREDGRDRDHGDVEGWQKVDGEGLIAEDAEHDQCHHQHDGEDRPADCDVVQIHDFFLEEELRVSSFEF